MTHSPYLCHNLRFKTLRGSHPLSASCNATHKTRSAYPWASPPGHEPATPFATHIAKLFENSLREDSILTLAYGGIIYAPGSAGTMQEIFQDAVQNHYLSFGFSSPMVFLGRQFWTEEMPAYTLLSGMMQTGKYRNLLLTLSDDSQQIIAAIEAFREKAKSKKK